MNYHHVQVGAAAEGCAAKQPMGCLAEDSTEGHSRVIGSPPYNQADQIQQIQRNLIEVEVSSSIQTECAAAEDGLETKYVDQCSEDDDDGASSSDREWWGSDDEAA